MIATISPNQLPLLPTITPGFSVGGVILLVSGVVYTFVGIKNKWLHIFLSAAYLASLGVTVLVIYVMNPPVSNAIQGAYLVAIVMTGLVLGGAATIFTEMTEGLGCLFGGFCFSMWLLVLQPGGLLASTSARAIFIAAFTLAGFSTSFSHYTRPYGLITLVSFGGATAVVMGIDCFSRAGLKEFWAYLWDLNSNLFPLGATTYPLTRGIKVEIAAIIVLFLAGVISQMKLWKLIKERRDQRDSERINDERNMVEEEENVGRRIEEANAEERDQWEAVYGDKDAASKQSNPNRDSGVGDMESQKKGPQSIVASVRRSDDIEMAHMANIPMMATGAGLVMAKDGVTVRVAQDEPGIETDDYGVPLEPENKQPDDKVWVLGPDGEARLQRRPSQKSSKRNSYPMSPVPDVVPLPFKIPEDDQESNRSSVATFADEDQDGQRKRHSKRLSQASVLMRKLSGRSQLSPRSSHSRQLSLGDGPSTEYLMERHVEEDDRRSSLAATIDGLSDDGDMRSIRSSRSQAPHTETAQNLENPSLSPRIEITGAETALPIPERSPSRVQDVNRNSALSTTILDVESANHKNAKPKSPMDSEMDGNVQKSLTASTDPISQNASVLDREETNLINQSSSVVSDVRSKKGSITKSNLPASSSKVAMSYRTNEWAKHLSNAELPDVDELQMAQYQPVESKSPIETATPVDVQALQQTPDDAMLPPAPKSVSQTTNYASVSRTNSMQSLKIPPKAPTRTNSSMSARRQENSTRNTSGGPPQTHQNSGFVRLSTRSSSIPLIPGAIAESPIEEDFGASTPDLPGRSESRLSKHTPYGSTNTLIGQRDSYIRNKSFYANPSGGSSSQDFPQSQNPSQLRINPDAGPGSDAGSIYNSPVGIDDDDDMPLSARRNIIRQSSQRQFSTPTPPSQQPTPIPFDSHQPRRQSSVPNVVIREQQLASWRASVQQDLHKSQMPKASIEQQRSAMWQERRQEEQRKSMQEHIRGERDKAFDERMRRGDMLDAHREALRKMQAAANRSAS